jgi:PPK2 family polyphosphate:nucleotide phosphotransferase
MPPHRFNHSRFIVPSGKSSWKLADHDPADTDGMKDKSEAKNALQEDIERLSKHQDILWASAEYAVVVILQAMDAAGKDGTIKHVMSGLNPQGVEVHSFKAPSEEERLRHFLWRPMRVTPARGRIALFNRSYYEEVLVVRVHPEFLNSQGLPEKLREKGLDHVWKTRYEEINTFEKLWATNNVIPIKIFLNVSREEQKARFLERLDDPQKNWKFNAGDVAERGQWKEYMQAYEAMLRATSTEKAPWYVVPADKKWFTRAVVADIIATRIAELDLSYPKVKADAQAALATSRQQLENEKD